MRATNRPSASLLELPRTEARSPLESGDAERLLVDPAGTDGDSSYRSIFENAVEGMFQTTPSGRYLRANPALARLYGYRSPRELVESLQDIARELYVDPARRDEFCRLMREEGSVTGFESQVHRRDGSKIWVSENARAVLSPTNGEVLFYEGTVLDITKRKQAEESLRESEERYALAVRGANDGIWDWNLRSGRVFFSARWCEMLGLDESETVGTIDDWFQRVHSEDLPRLKAELEAHLEGSTPNFENEYRVQHRDGTFQWMLSRGLAVRDTFGRATRMAGSQTDISKRKAAEEQILHSAFHDALTGLPNRSLLMDRLARSIWRCKRQESHLFALLFLDLDRFKVINDSLGHMAGDRLLIAIARRLEKCLRAVDSIARIGGDEFAILLEDLERAEDATRVAQRIEEALKLPFPASGQEVFTAASIGIALSSTGYDRPEDVLRDADIAMFRAKNLGRSRFEVFDRAMHEQALNRLRLETDLRRAVESEQFYLVYQPIIDLGTDQIVGFESLIRWRHPERGFLSPAVFIPLAEEMGLIVPMGRWVLRESCRQMRRFIDRCGDKAPKYISVNLSGRQFYQSDLVECVESAVRDAGLDPSQLRLELTESVLMDKTESTADILFRLKTMGINISVDDFGTGYSSLSYLQRFPVHTLKVDKSFTDTLTAQTEHAPMVQAIVGLAHGLGMEVVAEGVEKAEQVAALKRLGCEFGQGYFFAKPIEAEPAEALLGTGIKKG